MPEKEPGRESDEQTHHRELLIEVVDHLRDGVALHHVEGERDVPEDDEREDCDEDEPDVLRCEPAHMRPWHIERYQPTVQKSARVVSSRVCGERTPSTVISSMTRRWMRIER